MLGPLQQTVELDRTRRPRAHRARQILEHGQRPAPAAIRHRVRDLAPRHEHPHFVAAGWPRVACREHRCIAEQLGDVRHSPVLRGLDEPVVVELADVSSTTSTCSAMTRSRSPQRVAALAVVHRWTAGSKLVEAIDGSRHARAPTRLRMSVSGRSGLKNASCACRGRPATTRAPWTATKGAASIGFGGRGDGLHRQRELLRRAQRAIGVDLRDGAECFDVHVLRRRAPTGSPRRRG